MHLTLSYTLTDECRKALDNLDAERYTVRRLIPEGLETIFALTARHYSARGSTAIEGNRVDEATAQAILVGDELPRTEDEIEIANINEAYEHAYQFTSDRNARIDEGTIRALNSVLQKGSSKLGARSRGAYRPVTGTEVTIRDAATREVVYFPPPADDVSELMRGYVEDVARWVEEEPGPVAAALAHFGLVSIHPFEDGNGRTARLVADMVLDLTGWSIDRMVSVSAAIEDSGGAYFEALRDSQGLQFSDGVDATAFVEYHTLRLLDAADSLQRRAVRYRRAAETVAVEFDMELRDVWLSAYLTEFAAISSSTYARLVDVSQTTATKQLNEWVRGRALERVGGGRNTRYRSSRGLREAVERYDARESGGDR